MWMWILISLNVISKLHGYSGGNFPQACESMLPNHDGTAPQTTEPPFMVEHVPGTYPGDPVTVLLKSKGSTEFMGFMLEARKVADETRLTGKFVLLEPDKTRLLTCGGLQDSAVSQKNNRPKILIQVNWTAIEPEQDIVFRATFLQSFYTFWEKVDSTLQYTTTTTTTTPEPTTTRQPTTKPNTTAFSANIKRAGIALICFGSVLTVEMKGICNIGKVLLTSEAVVHRINKVSKIAGNVLCIALEISSLILFCVGDSFKVIFFALVCVMIVINFTEVVIVSLGIGRGPEGRKICDNAASVCFVIHKIITIAVIFLGVMENDSRNNVRDSWLLQVMIAYTVWDFLNVIWIVTLSSEKRGCLGMRERNKHQRKKMTLRDAVVIAVSVILFAGAISFSITIIFGIFTC